MAERATVFFYGLFMDPEALQEQGLRPSNPRRAYVDRVVLRLGKRATSVPDSEGRVHGVLMTLMHSDIDRLYSDASVAAYRPEPVLAQLEDGTAEVALCFNLPTAPDGATTNPEYAAALQGVARKMGLPEHYAARLSG
jgi:hypothetical protein